MKVSSCTGENLYLALKQITDAYGLSLADVVGFSSDGAANVSGKHNSAWSRIKGEAPDAIQLKCTCHSLQLCIQHAFETLPSSIGALLTDLPNYFRTSTLRREEYLSLFKLMNDGESPFTNTFTQFCATRWLGRSKVIFNIVTQWWELKAYFDIAQTQAPMKERYRARELYNMLADRTNLLYFHFLCPLVSEIEAVNKAFQSSSPDMSKLLDLLDLQHRSVRSRIFDVNQDKLKEKHLSRVDLGAKFEECAKDMDKICVDEVRERCKRFLQKLDSEIEKRIPENKNVLKGVILFNPDKIVATTFADLPFKEFCPDIAEAENQLRKLKFMTNEDLGFQTPPDDPVVYWAHVKKHKILDQESFSCLATYALNVLSLPVSNAYVEKVFSLVTFFKDKYSNSMGLPMLDSLLLLKTHLQAIIYILSIFLIILCNVVSNIISLYILEKRFNT